MKEKATGWEDTNGGWLVYMEGDDERARHDATQPNTKPLALLGRY